MQKMIKIDLQLFVTLFKYQPENNEFLEIQEGTSVGKLILDLGIPKDLVKLIFVNGKRQKTVYELKNNDRLGLFPPVGGG